MITTILIFIGLFVGWTAGYYAGHKAGTIEEQERSNKAWMKRERGETGSWRG